MASASIALASTPIGALQGAFMTPPDDARPMVRWWWFGPAVVPPQLEREMALMKAGGFGGFEVQPTYPLALDGQYPGLRNIKFLSPEFYRALGFTAAKAKEMGLRMDLTLGSGWPYGGPMFSRKEAAQSIRDGGIVEITPGQREVAAPTPTGRGAVADAPVVAALLGPIADPAPGGGVFVPLPVKGDVAELPADLRGARQVRFFSYAPANLMQVKRAAYGAEGFIIDHYSPAAIEKFITAIAEPEIAACSPNPPFEVFCDSLEIVGEGWTPGFATEFRRRRGYDLLPLLPALFDASFPNAAEIRGDYGLTLAELFNDVFADRFTRLAHRHGSRFRLQAYGTPPTTLETYARIDVNEGENHNWRALSGTRWAASASHLLGRKVTSSEAFTWLHSPVFMAAPIDLKAESNLQFLNGVNHLVFHGWPYTAPGVEYPGWHFYAAGVFNEKNPWWIVMPDINRYLTRTSFLLQQGAPANDIALYLPEEDAFAAMTPSSLQMLHAAGRGILNGLVNRFIPPILDAGFNFDGIDAGMLALRGKVDGPALAFGDVKYRAVILPQMTRITPAALRKLAEFAASGGILVAVGAPPQTVPGYLTPDADRQAVRDLAQRLFSGANAKGVVVPLEELAPTLRRLLQPDVAFAQPQSAIGFVHRHAFDAELYFLANTSNEPIVTTAEFRAKAPHVEWWDAVSGQTTRVEPCGMSARGTTVTIQLPPYGAKFLVFARQPSAISAPEPMTAPIAGGSSLDLSRDWDVTFQNAAPEANPAATRLAALSSWTERPETRHFSGTATYHKRIDVSDEMLRPGLRQYLDFGSGKPATVAGGSMGMRANFQPPIGDAAVVYVNGQRAGALWCPPYRVDVTGLVRPGDNEFKIEVANRAVNTMADATRHPPPDYRALNANAELGGNRFQPQDMNRIEVMPSGLLEAVHLQAVPPET